MRAIPEILLVRDGIPMHTQVAITACPTTSPTRQNDERHLPRLIRKLPQLTFRLDIG